ncbi:T9SS type A sorting domain-containing protein, partial [Candidatus Poribacteria bacterium]|nr:T9SS type A sorting domain-containing protein [Candidatus Poribacteria bacterium]
LNGDRLLDLEDMSLIEAARVETVVGAPATGVRRVRLVEGWLDEARRGDDGSALYREGIASLDHILIVLRPKASALLPNYPNPFNPETWIPFDLSEASDVALTIYDIRGRVVRRIDLGYQDTGSYRNRGAAAYWDGVNDRGEPVASGAYIYELHAGDYREARRMVIRK